MDEGNVIVYTVFFEKNNLNNVRTQGIIMIQIPNMDTYLAPNASMI